MLVAKRNFRPSEADCFLGDLSQSNAVIGWQARAMF